MAKRISHLDPLLAEGDQAAREIPDVRDPFGSEPLSHEFIRRIAAEAYATSYSGMLRIRRAFSRAKLSTCSASQGSCEFRRTPNLGDVLELRAVEMRNAADGVNSSPRFSTEYVS